MFNNIFFLSLVCLPLFLNCAGHRQAENNAQISSTHNLVPVYSAGFDVREVKDGLFIEAFDAGSPAKAAGMQKGDLIVSINCRTPSNKEFLKLMHSNRGEAIIFKINRYGQLLDYTITPKLYFNSPPSAYKIYELSVIDEQKVNLAVIVTEVRNNTSERNYLWEESTRHQIQENIENNMLNNLDRQDRLSFVNRSRLDEIIDSYKLDMAGITSDDARAEIGKTTGATHLLVTTFARNPKRIKDRESCADTVTGRLIDVKSGKVLAVDENTSDCKQLFVNMKHHQ
jgi:PDZ domain-containing protein/peptidoglycan-synthase activator LpoB